MVDAEISMKEKRYGRLWPDQCKHNMKHIVGFYRGYYTKPDENLPPYAVCKYYDEMDEKEKERIDSAPTFFMKCDGESCKIKIPQLHLNS